jgi:hypothetical protein
MLQCVCLYATTADTAASILVGVAFASLASGDIRWFELNAGVIACEMNL